MAGTPTFAWEADLSHSKNCPLESQMFRDGVDAPTLRPYREEAQVRQRFLPSAAQRMQRDAGPPQSQKWAESNWARSVARLSLA